MDNDKSINGLSSLWHQFTPEDTIDEMKWYCKEMADNGNGVFTVFDGDKCVGGVTVSKLRFNYEGVEIPIGLMTFLCIDTSYREDSPKYITEVIDNAICYGCEYDIYAFICYAELPILEHFYKDDFSFVNCERVIQATVETKSIPSVAVNKYRIEITDRNISKEYKEITGKLYKNYLIHSDKIFDRLTMLGSEYFLAYDSFGVLKGIAVRYDRLDSKCLYELVAFDDDVKNALLATVVKHYDWDSVSYTSIGADSSKAVLGQNLIRVFKVKEMLELFAVSHPDYSDVFTVCDTVNDKNNATYCISGGKCQAIPHDETARIVDISQLTALIFGKDYYLNLCCAY